MRETHQFWKGVCQRCWCKSRLDQAEMPCPNHPQVMERRKKERAIVKAISVSFNEVRAGRKELNETLGGGRWK